MRKNWINFKGQQIVNSGQQVINTNTNVKCFKGGYEENWINSKGQQILNSGQQVLGNNSQSNERQETSLAGKPFWHFRGPHGTQEIGTNANILILFHVSTKWNQSILWLQSNWKGTAWNKRTLQSMTIQRVSLLKMVIHDLSDIWLRCSRCDMTGLGHFYPPWPPLTSRCQVIALAVAALTTFKTRATYPT